MHATPERRLWTWKGAVTVAVPNPAQVPSAWPEKPELKKGPASWPQGPPCGSEFYNYIEEQLGYCFFGGTPVDIPAAKIGPWGLITKVEAAITWLFFLCAVTAAYCYISGDTEKESAVGTMLRRSFWSRSSLPYHEIYCKFWMVYAILDMFPTEVCILVCNICKVPVLVNQGWSVVLLPCYLAYYNSKFEGYALNMFGIGFSAIMFFQNGFRQPISWVLAPLTVLLAVPTGITAANSGKMSNYQVARFLAYFFFGAMAWSSIISYPPGSYGPIRPTPERRLWTWKGPTTFSVPNPAQVPAAWATPSPANGTGS
jgi:hypothetical protein